MGTQRIFGFLSYPQHVRRSRRDIKKSPTAAPSAIVPRSTIAIVRRPQTKRQGAHAPPPRRQKDATSPSTRPRQKAGGVIGAIDAMLLSSLNATQTHPTQRIFRFFSYPQHVRRSLKVTIRMRNIDNLIALVRLKCGDDIVTLPGRKVQDKSKK